MSKITFLGTCAGTEPYPNMHHTSFVFEVGGVNYFFDAGECCSHTAYTLGVDLTKTRAIFISHSHIDHIGGLPNLIYVMNKLVRRYNYKFINDSVVDLYLPEMSLFEAIMRIARSNRPAINAPVAIKEHKVSDGVVFADERISVTALHNTHLKEDEEGWRSYSYLIEAEGKRIVYSGDVNSPEEFDALIGDHADVLIMETGHHKVADVLDFFSSHKIDKLIFNHNGREILDTRGDAEALIKESRLNAKIAYDGMTEII
jgi:ribonuclease Z